MKRLCSVIMMLAVAVCAMGATFPKISVEGSETWYFIQFTSGGAVVADKGEGAEVQTAAMEVADAQQWKVEGTEADGYTFTNKLGRMLYVTATAQNSGFFRAAASPADNSRFVITANAAGDGFLIAPRANASVYMNQWGGAGAGKRLGLWSDKTDTGSMVAFMEASDIDPSNVIPLIPYPVSLKRGEGMFDVATLKAIYYGAEEYREVCEAFAEELEYTFGTEVTLAASGSDAPAITITKGAAKADATEQDLSAYGLDIDATGITVNAVARPGCFYALTTLRQLMLARFLAAGSMMQSDFTIPCLSIEDRPRFAHRGYMLDVARHFFTKEDVKTVLDIMALYKLNVFHWHLTDDQGWRIEIPEYPRLTEVGAIREKSFTNVGLSTTFYDDTEYGRGCYFTLDDLREIVAYAAERNITIIPEVDMPGHMVAALASYPEFSCDPTKTYSVRIDSGISHDILDISNPAVMDFLKCVLGHIAEVFPGKLIHIGGDECPTENWSASANCQAFAKEKGLTIDQLQGWLVEELGKWLRDNYGKDIVVWDELLSRWPSTNEIKPVVMAWNNISKSADAANRGMKSIISPHQYLYLDFMQVAEDKADVNEGYQGGWSPSNINTLDEIYSLNPTSSLGGREEYALGPQGNMWTETCSSFSQVLYQLLPRGLALAEIGWTPNENKNWLNFLARLQSHDEIFDAEVWNYAKHFFDQSDAPEVRTLVREANDIINKTQPGAAGYVEEVYWDDLQKAMFDLVGILMEGGDPEEAAATLRKTLDDFKARDILMPDPGKTYQIVSASTYYKAAYDGSTVYAKGNDIRFHYTPQLEPEELWRFEPSGDAYQLRNVLTGKLLTMPSYNANVKLSDNGTPLTVQKATTANGKYTYVPGSVVIAKNGGATYKLFADATGFVKTYNDGKLCCQGTWRLQEVTDYRLMLSKLVEKARLIILTGKDGLDGSPSPDALAFLQSQLIDAAETERVVTEEVYARYLDVYAEYLAMPRRSVVDMLDEGVYYRIHNAYSGWSNYYAALGAGGDVVPVKDNLTDDVCLWEIRKLGGNRVLLRNKSNSLLARVASATQDTKVQTAAEGTEWQLSEYSSAESAGILIQTGDYSWYVNPNAWSYVLLKPIAWGACVWAFEATDVPTGVVSAATAAKTPLAEYYDLQGRRVRGDMRGVVICGGKKLVR